MGGVVVFLLGGEKSESTFSKNPPRINFWESRLKADKCCGAEKPLPVSSLRAESVGKRPNSRSTVKTLPCSSEEDTVTDMPFILTAEASAGIQKEASFGYKAHV